MHELFCLLTSGISLLFRPAPGEAWALVKRGILRGLEFVNRSQKYIYTHEFGFSWCNISWALAGPRWAGWVIENACFMNDSQTDIWLGFSCSSLLDGCRGAKSPKLTSAFEPEKTQQASYFNLPLKGKLTCAVLKQNGVHSGSQCDSSSLGHLKTYQRETWLSRHNYSFWTSRMF